MRKILIVTNIAPHYRKSLWLELLKSEHFNCSIAYGHNEGLGIKQIDINILQNHCAPEKIHKLKNYWYKNKVLFWQSGTLSLLKRRNYSIIVFVGEFQCLSTWLSAIMCRAMGIRVVFWGHGIYGNESKVKLFFRKSFYKLAHQHLLYSRRAKRLMVYHRMKSEKLYVVFNSLDYHRHKKLRKIYSNLTKEEVYSFFKNPSLPALIFIGRLTSVKKLGLLVHAVNTINSEKPILNLLFIGDGPSRGELSELGKNGIADQWLYLLGACYSEEDIGRYLSVADLCVSPGNVGLTAIHSLSFGTPVCTHNNLEKQMPEVEAIATGYNGFYFKENDLNDLVEGIKKWLFNNLDREQVREQCFGIIDKYYNPDYQLDVFKRLVNNDLPQF